MIVRMLPSGRSFKGLAAYLTHDAGAETRQRVAWTHTVNCAHDDAPSAVHEMLTTVHDAEALKEEAGVRAGGRALQKPVKHLSLNWHPSDQPDQQHMIATTQTFLEHMGWADHQALLVAHTDREHAHVHVMINVVHPETGLKLDDGLEKRRAQEWALEYERAQGVIHCEQRLLNAAEREDAPTREAWLKLKESQEQHLKSEAAKRVYDDDYMASEENRKIINSEEWKILKSHQRDEREAFMVEGKVAYGELGKAVSREVRETFRDEWADYYAQKKNGADAEALSELKAGLIERQNALFEVTRKDAFAEIHQARDAEYKTLLSQQKDERAELRQNQQDGVSSPHLLDMVNRHPSDRLVASAGYESTTSVEPRTEMAASAASDALAPIFRLAADEVCRPDQDRGADNSLASEARSDGDPVREDIGHESSAGVRDGIDGVAGIGIGALGGLAQIGERLFDGFLGGGEVTKPAPQPHPQPSPQPEFKPENIFTKVAAEARRQAEEQEKEARDQAYWESRDRTRD